VRFSKLLIAIICGVSLLIAALPYSAVYSESAQRRTPTPSAVGTATQGDATAALFGPATGDLALPLDFVETGLKVRDFKLKLRFYNPYTADDGNWLLAILPPIFHIFLLSLKSKRAAVTFAS